MSPRLLRPALVTACWLLLLGMLTSNALAIRLEHPDFTEDVNRPLRLLVIPPTANITRGKMGDNEPLIREASILEKGLAAAVAKELSARGYEVSVLSLEELGEDHQLSGLVDRVQGRALEAMSRAGDEPKGVRRGRFGVGDTAMPLLHLRDAEGLVFIRSNSLIHSKGRKWLAGLLDPTNLIAMKTLTQVRGAIFDTRDGQLLTLLSGLEYGPVAKNPQGIAKQVISTTFKTYPWRGQGQRVKDKHRSQAPPRDLSRASQASEMDVLAAFEAIAVDEPGITDLVADTLPLSKDLARGPASAGEDGRPATMPTSGAASVTPVTPVAPQGPDSNVALSPRDMFERSPAERGGPLAQIALLGDAGTTALQAKNRMPSPIRVSVDLLDWIRLQPGESLSLELAPGSHRLLVAQASADRELARAAIILTPGRLAIAEIWPQ